MQHVSSLRLERGADHGPVTVCAPDEVNELAFLFAVEILECDPKSRQQV